MIAHQTFPSRHEQGAILVTALIILVLMTLIGVTAMQSSNMEERMAGNLKELHRSFQTAEAGLRLGEEYAVANTPGSAYDSGFVALYDAGDAVNADEVIPEYRFSLSAPSVREVTDASGETATSAKGAAKKLYTNRYTVDATGRVGTETATTTIRSSYVVGGF